MSNTAKRRNPTKVITGVVRLSYANVHEPQSINGGTPKYSVSLIIPKSDTKTIAAINAAVEAAIEEGRGNSVARFQISPFSSCLSVMVTLIARKMKRTLIAIL